MCDNIPYDPCGHIKLAVSDYKKSYFFYKAIFDTLGYKQVVDKEKQAGWTSNEGYGILITQAKITNSKYEFGFVGIHHLCLKANSVEIVDKVYKILLEKDIFIFDPPKTYKNYTDKYYAIYFADPDGMKLEVAYY